MRLQTTQPFGISIFGGLALAAALVTTTPASAQVEHGRLNVVQNDTANNTTSVSVTKAGGSANFNVRAGSNRGDYNVQFSDTPTSDGANGIVLTSIRQNGRDNVNNGFGGAGDLTPLPTGPLFATSAATTEATGAYFLPIFAAISTPDNAEFNTNVSAAFFRFSDGWIAGRALNPANNTTLDTLVGTPGLTIGTDAATVNFFDDANTATNGTYTLNLNRNGFMASSLDGILLVGGAKNEDNYALSRANLDGTFTIFGHDNAANASTFENDPIAFAYVPKTSINVVGGRVNGDASTDLFFNGFTNGSGVTTITKQNGTGRYLLQIAGQSEDSGTLILSAEGGDNFNVDNILTYQYDSLQNGWVVETRDLSASGAAATPQNLGDAEDAFSFAFFADSAALGALPAPANVPEPSTLMLGVLGISALGVIACRRRRVVAR